jgi:hypothetical protein
MYVLLLHQERQVYIQHHCCVCHKDMLHVEILVGFVFVPDKITDKSTHYEAVSTQFFQKVTVGLEDFIWDNRGNRGLRVELSCFSVHGEIFRSEGFCLAV